MREISLRPGESITIGDTVIRAAECASSMAELPTLKPSAAEDAFSKSTSPAYLLNYLNAFSVEDQEQFARRCGTTIGYMRLVAYGNRTCREKLAINIDRESGGIVSLQTLRPDVDWDHVRAQGRAEGGEHA